MSWGNLPESCDELLSAAQEMYDKKVPPPDMTKKTAEVLRIWPFRHPGESSTWCSLVAAVQNLQIAIKTGSQDKSQYEGLKENLEQVKQFYEN